MRKWFWQVIKLAKYTFSSGNNGKGITTSLENRFGKLLSWILLRRIAESFFWESFSLNTVVFTRDTVLWNATWRARGVAEAEMRQKRNRDENWAPAEKGAERRQKGEQRPETRSETRPERAERQQRRESSPNWDAKRERKHEKWQPKARARAPRSPM